MHITRIDVYQVDLPVVDGPYKMALSQVHALDSTIVEVVTDEGLSGFGETCPAGPTYQPHHARGARAAIAQMAPDLIGVDPCLIEQVGQRMDESLRGHHYAKAAIDVALWDLLGKSTGLRLCDLLGGAARESVPSYCVVGLSSPDEAVRVARRGQEEGYPRLQVKVGGRDVEADIETVRRVNEIKSPGVSLAVDANRGWTVEQAVHFSSACRDLVLVLEQPCDTYEEVATLRGRIQHPVYLDEVATDVRMVMRAIHEGVADGFGMKATRVGGISAMRTIRDICKATNRPISTDDSWGGDIIAAACVHLGATVDPRLLAGVWIADRYIDGNYDPQNGVRVDRGWISVPSGPGLGISPDKSGWAPPVAYD